MEKGVLIGHPVQGIRVVLEDGQTHAVDSSDMAFRFAAMSAVKESILKAGAQVLEPIMSVEVSLRPQFVQHTCWSSSDDCLTHTYRHGIRAWTCTHAWAV